MIIFVKDDGAISYLAFTNFTSPVITTRTATLIKKMCDWSEEPTENEMEQYVLEFKDITKTLGDTDYMVFMVNENLPEALLTTHMPGLHQVRNMHPGAIDYVNLVMTDLDIDYLPDDYKAFLDVIKELAINFQSAEDGLELTSETKLAIRDNLRTMKGLAFKLNSDIARDTSDFMVEVYKRTFGRAAYADYEVSTIARLATQSTVDSYYGAKMLIDQIDTVYYPTQLAKALLFVDMNETDNIYLTSAGDTSVSSPSDPIGKIDNLATGGPDLLMSVDASRPAYQINPPRIVFDASDDALEFDVPVNGWSGTFIHGNTSGVIVGRYAEPEGTAAYPKTVNVDVGSLNNLTHLFLANGILSAQEIEDCVSYLKENGAGNDVYSGSLLYWFFQRQDIIELDLSRWDVSAVTVLTRAFFQCTNLVSVDTTGWDLSSLSSLDYTFYQCSSLTDLDVSNWDVSSVTQFRGAFQDCNSLAVLDTSNWDTSSAIAFQDTFRNTSIVTLDMRNWDTSNVVNFVRFAVGASNLTNVLVNGGTGNPFADSPCTNYGGAFQSTNLSEESIDSILVAIEMAGTSGGTFFQSGGSAPSAVGEAAIDALTDRGWDITVTGGYETFYPQDISGAVAFFDFSVSENRYTTTAMDTSAASPGDPLGRIVNLVAGGPDLQQSTPEARTLFADNPPRAVYDGVDDAFTIDVPVGGWTGTCIHGSMYGITVGTYSVAEGTYQRPTDPLYYGGEDHMTHLFLADRILTDNEIAAIVTWMEEHGANSVLYSGNLNSWYNRRSDYTTLDLAHFPMQGVVELRNTFFLMPNITSIDFGDNPMPLATVFNATFMASLQLVSIDLSGITTPSATTFTQLCRNCYSLETLTFEGGTGSPFVDSAATSFNAAFYNTSLLEATVDSLLVALESTGNSNGSFSYSVIGGIGEPPSAVGEAAIDALRGRGWSIAVEGGY